VTARNEGAAKGNSVCLLLFSTTHFSKISLLRAMESYSFEKHYATTLNGLNLKTMPFGRPYFNRISIFRDFSRRYLVSWQSRENSGRQRRRSPCETPQGPSRNLPSICRTPPRARTWTRIRSLRPSSGTGVNAHGFSLS
jgi:hypothetical protein